MTKIKNTKQQHSKIHKSGRVAEHEQKTVTTSQGKQVIVTVKKKP